MRAADGVEPPAPAALWPHGGPAPITEAAAAAPGSSLTVPATRNGTVTPMRGFAHGFVPDPASPSTRMHGRVFFRTASGSDSSCSGTAIRSNRLNLVLTAGHCVHGGSHTGDWAKRFAFVPAYSDGQGPFGIWRATRLYAMPIWVEFGDPTGDIGMATMQVRSSERLQGVVGARGITFGRGPDRRYTAYGYPANPRDGFDGRRERFCRSRFAGRDPVSERGIGPKTISMRCDMTQGASGGSW